MTTGPEAGPGTRRPAGDIAVLAVAAGAAGVLAYVYLAVGVRRYGASAMAPVSVLWSAWVLLASGVTMPIEQWMIRALQTADGPATVRDTLRRLALPGAAGVLGLGALAASSPERLFPGATDTSVYPLLLMLIASGAVLLGVWRGAVSAGGRFRLVALALGAENGLRLAAAMFVVLVGGGPRWFAATLPIGFLTVLLRPGALRPPPVQHRAVRTQRGVLGALAGGNLLSQLSLTSPPVLAAAMGVVPQDVTALFASLVLFRAPQLVVVSAMGRLVAAAGQCFETGNGAVLDRVWRLTLVGTLVFAPLGGLVGAVAGPQLVTFVFGHSAVMRPDHLALIATAGVFAVAAVSMGVLLIAARRTTEHLGAWIFGTACGGLALVAPGESLTRIVIAFAISQALAWSGLTFAARRAIRPASSTTGPD